MTSAVALFLSLRYRAVDISTLFFQTTATQTVKGKRYEDRSFRETETRADFAYKTDEIRRAVLLLYTCAFSSIRDKTVGQTDATWRDGDAETSMPDQATTTEERATTALEKIARGVALTDSQKPLSCSTVYKYT